MNEKLNDFIEKYKNYYVYIINISNDYIYYKEIINNITDDLINFIIINNENNTCIISNNFSDDMNQIINSLIDDIGVNISFYKSNKLDNIDEYYIIKDIFEKYSLKINKPYITNRMLIEKMLYNDLNDLEIIKPIILKKLLKDNKLFEIVNGMFINNLNVCKTADYVYMHRNTINNKLNIIKEETGLDIQNFQDAVMLYVLIKK